MLLYIYISKYRIGELNVGQAHRSQANLWGLRAIEPKIIKTKNAHTYINERICPQYYECTRNKKRKSQGCNKACQAIIASPFVKS